MSKKKLKPLTELPTKRKAERNYTEAELATAKELASHGLNDAEVLNYLGYFPGQGQPLEKFLSAKFLEATQQGRAQGISDISKGVFERAKAGSTLDAIFWLKSVAGWQTKQRVEINHTETKRIQLVLPKTVSEDQWRAMELQDRLNNPEKPRDESVGEPLMLTVADAEVVGDK